MNFLKLIQILLIVIALTIYASWVTSVREAESFANPSETSTRSFPGTDIPLLRTSEAKSLWHKSSTLFLDVRSPTDYAYGHVTGAINLPETEIEKRLADLQTKLQSAGALVIYCKSVDCGKSYWAALRLRKRGLAQIKIYPAGWNAWSLEGLPTRRTATR